MPELPEVETIRRGLEKFVMGHTITDISVRLPKMFIGAPQEVIGGKIVQIRRFGKGLVIDLDNGYSLAVHVKMTGQLLYVLGEKSEILPNKHTHVLFQLSSPNNEHAELFFNDQRQFGWIKVVKTEHVHAMPFFKSLGKEPLKDLSLDDFQLLLAKAKTPIKVLLMDQSKIAGVGNIYANDALYRGKIHPKRPANSLSLTETETLFRAMEDVLKKGIASGGASEWHYVDVLGGKGQYQKFFLVYGKDGKPCTRCGTLIERISLGGRGTFYCPQCQRLD